MSSRARRGFTLAELMVVVAMVGVLSALAIYGVRKYVFSAKISEPIHMVGQIKASQEAWREEFHAYYNVSADLNAATAYPGEPKNQKRAWRNPAHADYQKWLNLGVSTNEPVHFGYATMAGAAGAAPPSAGTVQSTMNWPTPSEPWFVVKAMGDRNEDGVLAIVVGSSFAQELYVENEQE